MQWACEIFRTGDGVPQSPVVPSVGSWATSITQPGEGSHSFKLEDSPLNRDQWRALTQPWARTITQSWVDGANVGTPYAGVIKSRAYDRSTKTLTVKSVEIRSIFARRYPFAVGDPTVQPFNPDGALSVVNRSYAAAVRAVIMASSTAAGFALPFNYPADAAGSFSQDWPWYKFPTTEQSLSDIQNTDGGPHVDLRPSIDGSLSWDVRVGSPLLTGPEFEWLVTAGFPTAVDVVVTEDGSKQLTGVFSTGQGSGKDMKVGGARSLAGPDIPFMDFTRPLKNEADQGKLNDFAMAQLRAFRDVTSQVTFDFYASQTPNFTNMIPGSTLTTTFQGDPFVPDGSPSNYLMGMSGDLSEKISVTMQQV